MSMIKTVPMTWDLAPGQIDGPRLLPRYGVVLEPGVLTMVAAPLAKRICADYPCARIVQELPAEEVQQPQEAPPESPARKKTAEKAVKTAPARKR